MKYQIRLLLVSLTIYVSCSMSNAQVGINSDNSSPDVSAMLDIKSSSKGFLIPRMNSTSRKSIVNPADGLMVYDSTYHTYWYYDNGQWNEIRNGSKQIDGVELMDLVTDVQCSQILGGFSINEYTSDATISGNYIYLIDNLNNDFKIYDVSNPASPTFVGSALTGSNLSFIAVKDSFAYIVKTFHDELIIFDVSNPSSPQPRGTLAINPLTYSLTVSGNYLYYLHPLIGGMSVVDVSNPDNPTPVGELQLGINPRSLKIVDNYAYVLVESTREFKVIDVSNPSNPTAVGVLSIGHSPRSLALFGKYAFIVDDIDNDLKVIDIDDPNNPSLIVSLPIPGGSDNIVLSGNLALLRKGYDQDIQVVNISNPLNPVFQGNFPFVQSAGVINISGNLVYIDNRAAMSMEIIDLKPCPAIVNSNPNDGTFSTLPLSTFTQYLSLIGDNLSLSDDTSTIDLSIYRDNTDQQDLSIFNDTLRLSNDPSPVDLSSYLDNTDNQDLSILNDTLRLSNDSTPVDLSAYSTWTKNAGDVFRLNGRVGIGTDSPSALLDIQGDYAIQVLQAKTSNRSAYTTWYNADQSFRGIIGADGAGFSGTPNQLSISTWTNHPIRFFTNQQERMVIDTSGYVGLGVTSPNMPLTFKPIFGNKIALHGNFSSNHFGLGVSTGLFQAYTPTANEDIVFGYGSSTNFSETMRIKGNGSVGIGTTNPVNGKLEVNGRGTNSVLTPLGFFGILDLSGARQVLQQGVFPYGIYSSERVGGLEFIAFSDARIKNIFGQSNRQQDLNTLMTIEITDYQHIDTIQKGSKIHKKVIAQQVAKVFPQAVMSNTREVIPDIYKRAEVESDWINITTDLQVGDRVQIITKTSNDIHEVTAVEDGRFKVSDLSSLVSPLFVYGREVDDFHTVDYEAISMLNVSATQEQQRIIEQQQAEINALKAENAQFKSQLGRIDQLEAVLETLQSRVNNGQQMIADK